MTNYESFFDYCMNHLIDKLDEYEGTTHYACELAYVLCEEENINGSLTFSTYEAKEYLRTWWDDCSDYWEYEKFNFGENLHDPFDNPEAYMVCMVIEGVSGLLSQCASINDSWNEQITLDNDFTERLKSELSYVTKILW